MAGPKTRPNDADVDAFLANLPDNRRGDADRLCALLGEWTATSPCMWGKDIVGFGHRRSRYADGREGDWMRVGFSPRKRALSLSITDGLEAHGALLARLGKHRTGTCCLYMTHLADIDIDVLRELVCTSISNP